MAMMMKYLGRRGSKCDAMAVRCGAVECDVMRCNVFMLVCIGSGSCEWLTFLPCICIDDIARWTHL